VKRPVAAVASALVLVAAVASTLLLLAACGGSSPKSPAGSTTSRPGPTRSVTTPIRVGRAPASIKLSSPSFSGGTISAEFTCSGRDISPPLRWSSVPSGARELALELIDLDAPAGAFVHWSLARIRPSVTSLAAGESIPPGAVSGRNSFGRIGYGGPCPPPGDKPHRYVFVLLALRSPSGLSRGFGADALPASQSLAIGVLEATYERR
jgi:Raf kinase inhibitor-like YbhB/YbcL family protein